MTNPIVYDGIVALVLLWFVVRGYGRGFILTVSGVVVLLCAVIGANVAADVLTPVAGQMVTPKVEAFLHAQMTAIADDTVDISLETLLEGTQLELVVSYLDSDALDQAGQHAETFTAEVLGGLAETIAQGIVHSLLWIVAFIILCLLLNMAVRTLDLVAKLPVLQTMNALGGVVAGFVQGVLMVYVLLLVLAWLGYLPTEEVAAQTYVYSKVVAYNPLVGLANVVGV